MHFTVNSENPPSDTQYRPYQYIYSKYRHDDKDIHKYFKNSPGYDHPFRIALQIRLLHAIMEQKDYLGGAGLNFPV